MRKKVREDGVPIKTLWKLFVKNIFSVFYFVIVGLILAVIYTQFLLKPTYTASGDIENIGSISTAYMSTVTTIATEQETLNKVVEKMEIPASEQEAKINLIRSGLTVTNYSSFTLKTTVSYKGTNKTEVENVVNFIIDVSIERFVERYPNFENKVIKQNNAIVAIKSSASNRTIYFTFIGLGFIFGAAVGVIGDLINRRILFTDDLIEYKIPYNVINLDYKKSDLITPNETETYLKGVLVLQDRIEGTARRSKAKVIGVVNLGYETYDTLIASFGENLVRVGLKSLIIDLDIERPKIHTIYNVDNKTSVTNILNNKIINPIKVKDGLSILPASEYPYPARFLKDERLHKLIKDSAEKYDYVLVNIPTLDYYAPILFNFGLIDVLLINTSFGATEMKTLDNYIANIDDEHTDKLFLNAIDSRVKKDYSKIIDRIKGVFKRNKNVEDK
jgi:hypothetical protein